MQHKSDTKLHSAFDRIERYRLSQGLKWKDVSEKLDVSVAMLMMVKSGKRNVSDKVIARLEKAEKEVGLAPTPVSVRSRDQDFYDNMIMLHLDEIFQEREAAVVKLRPEDHDNGYADVPLEYRRGSPPSNLPTKIRLSRPSNREAVRILRELDETNEPELFLYACLPESLRDPEFLEKLSPLCILLMEHISEQLLMGARKSKSKQLSRKK